MKEKPTLQEWKRNNPGKSLNDYFKEYPVTTNTGSKDYTTTYSATTPPVQSNHSEEKEAIDIASILVSVMIFIAFFLPWIDIRLLGMFNFVKSSGFELPYILERIYQGVPPRALKSIYLLPICSFVAIVAETQKSWLKPVVQIVAILIVIYWFHLLKQLIAYSGYQLGMQLEPMKFFSFGIYLTFLGCAFYVYDVIREYLK